MCGCACCTSTKTCACARSCLEGAGPHAPVGSCSGMLCMVTVWCSWCCTGILGFALSWRCATTAVDVLLESLPLHSLGLPIKMYTFLTAASTGHNKALPALPAQARNTPAALGPRVIPRCQPPGQGKLAVCCGGPSHRLQLVLLPCVGNSRRCRACTLQLWAADGRCSPPWERMQTRAAPSALLHRRSACFPAGACCACILSSSQSLAQLSSQLSGSAAQHLCCSPRMNGCTMWVTS